MKVRMILLVLIGLSAVGKLQAMDEDSVDTKWVEPDAGLNAPSPIIEMPSRPHKDLTGEIDALKTSIDLAKDDGDRIPLLKKLNQLYNQAGNDNGALAYLEKMRKEYQGTITEAAATVLAVPIMLRVRQFDDAKERCRYIIDHFKNTYWAEESLYTLGEMYLNFYKDKQAADACFKRLVNEYPNSAYVLNARGYLGQL